jgi:hypothetical protein
VLPLPDELLLQHASLYDEFKNETHWPKHVLVHYHFRNEGDIDFQQGLYVLTALGEAAPSHPQPHKHPTGDNCIEWPLRCTAVCSVFLWVGAEGTNRSGLRTQPLPPQLRYQRSQVETDSFLAQDLALPALPVLSLLTLPCRHDCVCAAEREHARWRAEQSWAAA